MGIMKILFTPIWPVWLERLRVKSFEQVSLAGKREILAEKRVACIMQTIS